MKVRLARAMLLGTVVAAVAQAQAVFGVMRGTVVDSSGLPVPSAKVSVLNQNTRELRTLPVDSSGGFVFPALVPAPYTITVEAEGFKKFQKMDVLLSAEERLDAGQLRLEVGQVTESVSVTAAPVSVQTASSERSA